MSESQAHRAAPVSRPALARRPGWLKVKLPGVDSTRELRRVVRAHRLHTVCQSARCPNRGECWALRTAAFMILGDRCSRNCSFCAVTHGVPLPVDADEPQRVGRAIAELGLDHAVVTSVTRDDLDDGGAGHFASTIRSIRAARHDCRIEVLVPDFGGDTAALERVLQAGPDILNHNLETVSRLYPRVRPQADYAASLSILQHAARRGAVTKSGLMLGLGERPAQVREALSDLREADCQMVTLGQYLQPTREQHPVIRFVSPDEFTEFARFARELGFRHVESGPLVRSSYHAGQQFSPDQGHAGR